MVLQVIVEDQRMSHGETVRLHGVAGSIVIVTDLGIIEITNSSFGSRHI